MESVLRASYKTFQSHFCRYFFNTRPQEEYFSHKEKFINVVIDGFGHMKPLKIKCMRSNGYAKIAWKVDGRIEMVHMLMQISFTMIWYLIYTVLSVLSMYGINHQV
jgi:hypothetical protein